jgi:hypothetical protein
VNRPSLRLRQHRGTTAHVCSIYPFSVQPSFGHRGTYIGLDLLAGGAEFWLFSSIRGSFAAGEGGGVAAEGE